jgi:glycerophosphoryl diester phosphodiesterase
MRKKRTPLVLGHRGYRARFPENTLLAFRQAFAAGADGVECDLQKTADCRYVVIHDPDTARVSGDAREVGTTRFEDLRLLDFGRGERIPELGELLEAIPAGRYLDLELKEETLSPEDCVPIADILADRIDRRNLMISSFEPRLLVPFRSRGFTVGYLVGDQAVSRGAVAFAATLLWLRPQYLNLPIQLMKMRRNHTSGARGPRTARFLLALLRALGLSLLFWTVNAAEEAELVAGTARIIVTDEVEALLGWRDQSMRVFSRPAGGSG